MQRGKGYAGKACPAGGATAKESASLGMRAKSPLTVRQSGEWGGTVTSIPPLGVAERVARVRSSNMAEAGGSRSAGAVTCVGGKHGERTDLQS